VAPHGTIALARRGRNSRKPARIRQGKRILLMIKTIPSVAVAFVLALAAPALAKEAPQALTDWPCDTPFAGPLEPAMLWPDAPARPEGLWQSDPAAKRLVEFLSAGENSPAMGEREIADYAKEKGPLRRETAFLVVSGMVERGNILRRVLLEGLKQQIIRSHVLADVVAQAAVDIEAAERQRKDTTSLVAARRQNLNGLDDANDMAKHLCHRLVYDENKLKRLAATLRLHTSDDIAPASQQ
jgi:hypothetical protein